MMPEIFALAQAKRSPREYRQCTKSNATLAIVSDMTWSSNLTDVVGDFRKHQSDPSKLYFPQN